MIAQRNLDFFCALDALLVAWQQLSSIVDKRAENLIMLYKAYSTGACSVEEIEHNLLEFIRSHTEEFTLMFESFFARDAENFIQEIQRNLFSKTRRMKRIERKKWQLPEDDIVANIESAVKSAFYMHVRHLYNNVGKYGIPPGVATALFFFVREGT